MRSYQQTLARPVEIEGIGLHTGVRARVRLCPAPAYTGLLFRRVDLDGFEIPAAPRYVAHVSYATTLVRAGVMVATVEHLLAALYACGVDNAIIELDALEVPILDGSAAPFVELLARAGRRTLDAPRHYLRVRKPIRVGDDRARIVLAPDVGLRIRCTIEFAHPMIGRQYRETILTEETFAAELAPARTFGFLEDVQKLRDMGLIRGGSLQNAIVLDREGLLNPDGLRFPDEFVRHKMVDLLGDLALIGHPVLARVDAWRPGHAVNTAAVATLLRDPTAWELVAGESVGAVPIGSHAEGA
jgi:UDP-3-O-[3-hydroxymyristoyl] N-acetylglucosamine deacetylase